MEVGYSFNLNIVKNGGIFNKKKRKINGVLVKSINV